MESNDVDVDIKKYIDQLSDKERKVYNIAKEHLGTSFNILKSVGYINWKNKKM
jgi:hypothetical protein